MLISFFVFIIIASILVALTEIQIEGKFGWAKNLPTWRKTFSIGKKKIEVTGYHLCFFSMLFVMLHSCYIFQPLAIKTELFILSAYTFMAIFEDFFWFVFNPDYGLKKYNKENVYWFKTWILGFPSFYFIVLPIAIILLILAINIV